jgi:hypothetical protein
MQFLICGVVSWSNNDTALLNDLSCTHCVYTYVFTIACSWVDVLISMSFIWNVSVLHSFWLSFGSNNDNVRHDVHADISVAKKTHIYRFCEHDTEPSLFTEDKKPPEDGDRIQSLKQTTPQIRNCII